MPGNTHVRGTLLVVGSGNQIRHEHLLAQMAQEADLVLLTPQPADWQLRWVGDTEVFDPKDADDVLRSAKELMSRTPADAVVTFEEAHVVLTAQIGEALGLPGMPVEAAELARDKKLQRELLTRTGLSPTRSVLVHDLAAARAAAEDIGYPVVVKPQGLSGSAGVRRVEHEAELDDALRNATDAPSMGMAAKGLLIEEYLDGYEFSVDFWVSGGEAEMVYGNRKLWGFDPYPIEVGQICGRDALDLPALQPGVQLAQASVLAAGFDRVVAHIEVKMTSAGPRIVELNARPAGGLSPRVIELACGVKTGAALAAAALGRRPNTEPFEDRAAGLLFLYPAARMRFEGLAPAPWLRTRPWLHDVCEYTAHGTVVAPPPEDVFGQVGHVIVTGSDAEEVHDRLLLAEHELRVLGDPTERACAGH